jgi:hypothetical protein
MSLIKSYEEFEEVLKGGAYTDLGGYPLYFVMKDGEAMSFRPSRRRSASERRSRTRHPSTGTGSQWAWTSTTRTRTSSAATPG